MWSTLVFIFIILQKMKKKKKTTAATGSNETRELIIVSNYQTSRYKVPLCSSF